MSFTRSIPESVVYLMQRGISRPDAEALRKVAMTLHRWAEMECGIDLPSGHTLIIERDEETGRPFHHTSDGYRSPFIADREAGALKRLAAIMARYPDQVAYHQGDPRGASLYIVRKADIPEGGCLAQWYTRGTPVYR